MDEQFFKNLKDDYDINLNYQQRNAVIHTDGPILVLAVPGSGKTTSLLSRTAYLIFNGVKPENILSITFSKSSAIDMENKYNKLFIEENKKGASFSTIHSFAYSVINNYNKRNGIKQTIIEDSAVNKNSSITKNKILKKIYEKINNENINDEILAKLSNDIGYVKNSMIDINDYKNQSPVMKNLNDVFIEFETLKRENNFLIDIYDFNNKSSEIRNFKDVFIEYEKLKRENGFIDFDDMLSECLKIFNEEPLLLNEYKQKYKYIQVDEAQDTSKVQHEIIYKLGEPHNNIFYVADDDQSIYGFRAAFPKYLLDIKNVYPNVKILFMEENFRSTRNIVTLCNEFIKSNINRYNKNMFTSKQDVGVPVKIEYVEEQYQQVESIVTSIKEAGNTKSTAILYRNNSSAINATFVLYKEGIPFKLRGYDNNFFTHWILDDLFNYMKLAFNFKDTESFYKIYKKLKGFYINDNMIDCIRNDNSDRTVFQKLLDVPKIERYQIEKIIELYKHFVNISSMSLENTIEYIKHDLKYSDHLTYCSDKYGYDMDNLNLIVEDFKFLSKGLKSVSELIEITKDLDSQIKKSVNSKDISAITLSTVHSSKGLEWDIVYIIDLKEGTFPSKLNKDIEEERRLFYVAMTRAKKKLVLYRFRYINKEPVKESMFLKELERVMKNKNNYAYYKNNETNKNSNIKITQNENEIEKNYSIDIGNIVNHTKFGNGIAKKLENESEKEKNYSINIGNTVNHTKFGKGIVKKLENKKIVIMFEGLGIKELDLEICYSKKLLNKIN